MKHDVFCVVLCLYRVYRWFPLPPPRRAGHDRVQECDNTRILGICLKSRSTVPPQLFFNEFAGFETNTSGRISWNTVPLATPTPFFDRPFFVNTKKKL